MTTSMMRARGEGNEVRSTNPAKMPGVYLRVAIASASVGLLVACGAPPRTASAPATAASGSDYGYRFDVDSMRNATASPASDLSLPHAAGDRVPPETVQALVRSHYAAVERCYAAGVARQPSLTGTVMVKVIAGADGATQRADDDGSTLSDKDVVSCVVGAFEKIRYPRGGGMITVLYPIALTP